MKKKSKQFFSILFILLFALLTVSAAESSFNTILNVKPYFSWENFPFSTYTVNSNKKGHLEESADFTETSQEKYLRYKDAMSLLDLGVDMSNDPFRFVAILDIKQDAVNFFTKNNYSNIPFLGNSFHAVADMNWMRVGFLEYESDGAFASFGRRAIKWGPGSYGFAINDSAPFLDNIYLSLDFPVGDGNLWYDYTTVGFNNYALSYNAGNDDIDNRKTLFGHRFGYENSSFRVALSELNLFYNSVPSLLDASPLAFWHNNYQHDRSNVMIELTMEKLLNITGKDLRVFGAFAMDDFVFGSENKNSKPSALGFMLGTELNLIEGEAYEKSAIERSDYTLTDKSFSFSGGLNISYEWYWATAFLYNRDNNSGKFTVPMFIYNFSDGGYVSDDNAFFIGFPYGPDTMVHKFQVSYEEKKWRAILDAEIILKGEYRIEEEYTQSNNSNFSSFALNGDVATILKLNLSGDYNVMNGLSVGGKLGLHSDFKNKKNVFSVTLGCKISPLEIGNEK